jgi:REP element-mobilizing transposase RayT
MPRIARMIIKDEPAVYHVMSRTALDGFVLGDVEKEYLVELIKKLSQVYFAEVLGFCIMGNHFHLLVRMHQDEEYTDEEIRERFKLYYGMKDSEEELHIGDILKLRKKWSSLSEYMREIKQGFSRFYNKRHKRKGFFWSDRFKSVIVDNGETLINCLAYIDLNPIRAGFVDKPEDYRWSSIGYHVQTNNKDSFLSLDFGLAEFGVKSKSARLNYYLKFLYEKGNIKDLKKERERNFELSNMDRFLFRTRYFTDSGIIGSKAFVDRTYQDFKDHFSSKHEKKPKIIHGLEGVYSLKSLSEAI